MPPSWRPGACFKCGEPGHWALHCPRYRCTLCGLEAPGHYSRDCPNHDRWKCTNCNLKGHLYITCPKVRRLFACASCGQIGHGIVMCPRIDCLVCKGIGHTAWSCPTYSKKTCVRCGENGHFAPMCDRWARAPESRERKADASTGGTEYSSRGSEGHSFPEGEEFPSDENQEGPPSSEEDDTSSADEPQSAATDGPDNDHFDSSHGRGPFHPSWSHAGAFFEGLRGPPPAAPRYSTPHRDSQPEQTTHANEESSTHTMHDGPNGEGARGAAQFADHDDDCGCMLCDLTKGRRRQPPKLSARQSAPSSTGGTTYKEQDHGPAAHDTTCICSLCETRAANSGASSSTEQQAPTSPRNPQAPPDPLRKCGPTCTTKCCASHAERKPSEYSTDDKAMTEWKRGTAALNAGQTAQAIHCFNKSIERDPFAGAFFRSRGEAFVSQRDYAAALSDFQQAYGLLKVAVPATAAPVLVKMARCRLCLGSHSSALLAVQEALAIDSTNDAARALKRRLLQIQETEETLRQERAAARWHVARSTWNACVQLYEAEGCPVPIDLRCWKVYLTVFERDWEEAQSAANTILEDAPQAISAILAKINVHFLVGDLQQALRLARDGLKSAPDSVPLKELHKKVKDVSHLKTRGDIQTECREYAAALQCWKDALVLIPDLPEDGGGGPLRAIMLYNQAQAEAELQRFAEALRSIDASLKLDGTRWTTYRLRGHIHSALHLFDLSVDDLKTTLQKITLKAYGATASDISQLHQELTKAEKRAAHANASPKDYYKILQMSPTCSQADIRKAYKVQMLKHHPDKGGVEAQFKLVNEAYTTLSDPGSRRIYDDQRLRQPRRSAPH